MDGLLRATDAKRMDAASLSFQPTGLHEVFDDYACLSLLEENGTQLMLSFIAVIVVLYILNSISNRTLYELEFR